MLAKEGHDASLSADGIILLSVFLSTVQRVPLVSRFLLAKPAAAAIRAPIE